MLWDIPQGRLSYMMYALLASGDPMYKSQDKKLSNETIH